MHLDLGEIGSVLGLPTTVSFMGYLQLYPLFNIDVVL